MKVGVFVPHDINIFLTSHVFYRPNIRKYIVKENAKPIIILPKSGKMLSVSYKSETQDAINNIPVVHKVVEKMDLIPSDIDAAIVSGLYASATNDSRAYTIIDPVYSQNGKTVLGCLSIGKVALPSIRSKNEKINKGGKKDVK